MTELLKKFFIKENVTVKQAMRQMGRTAKRVLFIVDDQQKLLGSLTDGDIRRWVLAGGRLSDTIHKAYNKKPIFVKQHYKDESVKKIMLHDRIESIPVVDQNNMIKKILLWNHLFDGHAKTIYKQIDTPVVIMAGGKGTRLDPYTRVLPKPLVPIGEKTILELIIERFVSFGVEEFYLSIHHKSRMIKAYFEEISPNFKIHYIEEKKPLGTAGSLRLLYNKVKGSIMVSNCDIMIETDYSALLEFHESQEYDLSVVGSFRHYTIPYGVCSIENGGSLREIHEKPEYDFLANTGMYVLNDRVLGLIPVNKLFHMTDLIKRIKKEKGKVGLYPIDEKSWVDIGQLEEYHRVLKQLEINR